MSPFFHRRLLDVKVGERGIIRYHQQMSAADPKALFTQQLTEGEGLTRIIAAKRTFGDGHLALTDGGRLLFAENSFGGPKVESWTAEQLESIELKPSPFGVRLAVSVVGAFMPLEFEGEADELRALAEAAAASQTAAAPPSAAADGPDSDSVPKPSPVPAPVPTAPVAEPSSKVAPTSAPSKDPLAHLMETQETAAAYQEMGLVDQQVTALLEVARILEVELDDPSAAAETYEEALQANPDSAEALAHLHRLHAAHDGSNGETMGALPGVEAANQSPSDVEEPRMALRLREAQEEINGHFGLEAFVGLTAAVALCIGGVKYMGWVGGLVVGIIGGLVIFGALAASGDVSFTRRKILPAILEEARGENLTPEQLLALANLTLAEDDALLAELDKHVTNS